MKAVTILLCLVVPNLCWADPIDSRSTLLYGEPFIETDSRSILLDGKPFVAFDLESAQRLLQMRIDFPKIQLKLVNLEDLVEVKDLEIATLLTANDTLLETKNFLKTTVIDLQGRLDDTATWYRSPYFWYAVGLATGVGITVAIVYAVNP